MLIPFYLAMAQLSANNFVQHCCTDKEKEEKIESQIGLWVFWHAILAAKPRKQSNV